jgi:polar amino acid transport system permease protein
MIIISAIFEITPQLLRGLGITISVLLGSAIISYIVAFAAGLSRVSNNVILNKVTGVYVEVFRGTSLIVQLFWLYYAIPMLFGIQLGSNWWTGVIAIALNYQRMRFIILPQAVRMMLPEFGNYTIQMMKATSLVSLIGMRDILYYGDIMRNTNLSQAPLIYVVVLFIYFILALPLIWLTKKGETIAKKGVAG